MYSSTQTKNDQESFQKRIHYAIRTRETEALSNTICGNNPRPLLFVIGKWRSFNFRFFRGTSQNKFFQSECNTSVVCFDHGDFFVKINFQFVVNEDHTKF